MATDGVLKIVSAPELGPGVLDSVGSGAGFAEVTPVGEIVVLVAGADGVAVETWSGIEDSTTPCAELVAVAVVAAADAALAAAACDARYS